jgi:transposase
MRRSFDGLALLVRTIIRQNPVSGSLFVFRNQRGNCLKLFYWDGDGYAIWYKRLEKGTFPLPANLPENSYLAHHQLAMLLEGMEYRQMKRKKRFSLSG